MDIQILSNAIIWRVKDSDKYPNGVPKDYHSWSDEDKGNLSNTFWNSLMDISPGINEAPNCTVNLSDNGMVYSTDLKPDDAWKYYITHVAHSIRVEIDRLVHWSSFQIQSFTVRIFI